MTKRQRGFTIAEMLTVLFVVGLMLGAVAFAMPLFMNAPVQAQSQVTEVQSSALALYRMQHDARQSDINGMFTCAMQPVVSCATPAPPVVGQPATVQAVVMVTADDGSGVFEDNGTDTGLPQWQGFVVYWLVPNADGTSNELRRAYLDYPITPGLGGEPEVLPSDAVAAITAILAPAFSYETVAQDVVDMRLAFDTTNSIADIVIDGGQNTGNKSSISLSGNSYVRN